jgi:hypothetical protein
MVPCLIVRTTVTRTWRAAVHGEGDHQRDEAGGPQPGLSSERRLGDEPPLAFSGSCAVRSTRCILRATGAQRAKEVRTMTERFSSFGLA